MLTNSVCSGTTLTELSMEMGARSRSKTMAHNTYEKILGARLKNSRAQITNQITMLAVRFTSNKSGK